MNLFIDPAYKAYYQNRLFDLQDKNLNRDGTLLPFYNLKSHLEKKNINVQTFDFYNGQKGPNIYWSFGLFDQIEKLAEDKNLILDSFFVSEPPLVAKHIYDQLPLLTRHFDKVYVHNTVGDGYSLKNVDTSKLRTQYLPEPYDDVIEKYWNITDRINGTLVVNGQHRPRLSYAGTELYSKRIEVMVELSKYIKMDLYGRGWNKLSSRNSLWWTFIKNYSAIQKLYRGPVDSKFETMTKYDFALCFENSVVQGYLTEKIFDCFYAGTIPIFWGPPNVRDLLPDNCYIDYTSFSSVKELAQHLLKMRAEEKISYRKNARSFLQSNAGKRYSDSLILEFNKQEA